MMTRRKTREMAEISGCEIIEGAVEVKTPSFRILEFEPSVCLDELEENLDDSEFERRHKAGLKWELGYNNSGTPWSHRKGRKRVLVKKQEKADSIAYRTRSSVASRNVISVIKCKPTKVEEFSRRVFKSSG